MEMQLILAFHRGFIDASRLNAAQHKLYEQALGIVREAQAKAQGDYAVALALHDWIVLNSEYARVIYPEGPVTSILKHGKGLCECYARTYYLLTQMAGIDCRYVVGSADGEEHAWNLSKLNGTWVHVDCTYDDPRPDKGDMIDRYYFGLSDATIAKNHSWKRDDYPNCPTDEMWYAANQLPRFATLDEMAATLANKVREQGKPASISGFVEEVARQPKRLNQLIQTVVRKYNMNMGYSSDAAELSPGFVTLICR